MKYNEDEKINKKDSAEAEPEDLKDDKLGLFDGKDKPTRRWVLGQYQRCNSFNSSINLYDNVKYNENMYLGKQWEGAKTYGLPTITVNIVKPTVGFVVSTLTSERIKAWANILNKSVKKKQAKQIRDILNNEFEEINERCSLAHVVRGCVRSACIDGDGCIYLRWNPDLETGQKAKGGIEMELVDNCRMHFGDPSNSDVQSQEFVIMTKREPARKVKIRAKENGIDSWREIVSDFEQDNHVDDDKLGHDTNVTVYMLFYKDDESGEIWYYEVTQQSEVCKPVSLEIQMFPFVWLPYDIVKDCYHGQAMITGMIPNQQALNISASMQVVSLQRLGYPRIVADKTKIPNGITNQVGSVIYTNGGGSVNDILKVIDGAGTNPQIANFLDWMKTSTNESLGVNAASLGNVRSDNTSAILTNKRSGETPHENTRERAEHMVKEIHLIEIEYMKHKYGKRIVYVDAPPKAQMAVEMARMDPQYSDIPDLTTMQIEYDFDEIKDLLFDIKIDVGSASQYSEIMQSTTLQNAAQAGLIDSYLFWKCLPPGYVNNQDEIVKYYEEQHNMMQGMPPGPTGAATGGGANLLDMGQKTPIMGGGGNRQLQRNVSKGYKET